MTAIVGETLKFICISTTRVQWNFEGNSLPPNAVATTSTFNNILTIRIVRTENEGIYSCSGLDEHSKKFEENAKLTVAGKTVKY